MPDAAVLTETEFPKIKLEGKENFTNLRDQCSPMYGYCCTLIDNHVPEQDMVEAARQCFYDAYHRASKYWSKPEEYPLEDRVEVYRWFMDGMWRLLEHKEKLHSDTAGDWSRVWGLEDVCAEIYPNDWKKRHKV